MAEEAGNIPSPFDVRTIKHLIRLMSQHDLSEIDLREGDLRIRLRRGPQGVLLPPALPAGPFSPPPAPPAQATTSEPAKEPTKPVKLIKSPTPGTFYAASAPGAEPFVKVGSRVTPESTVCMIEAMKIFNEIPAECSGVVTEILVENQQAVEYGQVLFKVDPSA